MADQQQIIDLAVKNKELEIRLEYSQMELKYKGTHGMEERVAALEKESQELKKQLTKSESQYAELIVRLNQADPTMGKGPNKLVGPVDTRFFGGFTDGIEFLSILAGCMVLVLGMTFIVVVWIPSYIT
jgi:hypothetical protein